MAEPQRASGAEDEGARAAPGTGDGTVATECVEWCPICRTMDVLRASATPEVREQWEGVQREAVLTLRAVADHYARRLSEDR
jgi:hypothetical protein